MNKFSTAILKIILLWFSIVLAFTILEVAAKRILKTTRLGQKVKYLEDRLKENVHTIGSYDAYLGWGYLPNTSEKYYTSDYYVDYSINSKGFRDKEISIDKPLGEFRIVALGESTVFGEGINYGKRFTEIIQNSLDNVEVINMGVWGFGADQSLLLLEKEGFKFKPDAVILFVIQDFFERCKMYQRSMLCIKPRFVLNDNKDDIVLQDINFIKDKFSINIHPETSAPQLKNIPKAPVLSFIERSSLFSLLNSKKKILEINKMTADIDRSRLQGIGEQLEKDMKRGFVYKGKDFERLVFLMIKRYQEECKRNSTDFILVYIDRNKGYFLKYFANSCRDLGVKYIDLSDVLLKASNNYPLRFNIDPHYNEFAHRVIGEYVSGYIGKQYNLVRNKGYIYKWLGYFN